MAKKMKTSTKVLLGVGVAALGGLVFWWVRKPTSSVKGFVGAVGQCSRGFYWSVARGMCVPVRKA
jgi:hypothetical protein